MEKYLDWSVVYKIFLGGHFSELTKWKITRMECRGLVPESLAGRVLHLAWLVERLEGDGAERARLG